MTTSEAERLTLELHALQERRRALLAVLENRKLPLTEDDLAAIRRVIGLVEAEKAAMEQRLDAIRRP